MVQTRQLQQERARRTRARIIATVTEELLRNGLAVSSEEVIRHLGKRARVSKGAVYYHFPTWATLIEAVKESLLSEHPRLAKLGTLTERFIEDPQARLFLEIEIWSRTAANNRRRRPHLKQ